MGVNIILFNQNLMIYDIVILDVILTGMKLQYSLINFNDDSKGRIL